MSKLCTILVLAALVLAGLGANQICISDAGVSFAGHSSAAAGACGDQVHGGDMAAAITAGGCGDCVDIVGDSGEILSRSEQDFLRIATVPVLVAALGDALAAPREDTSVTAGHMPEGSHLMTGLLVPLSTIVLRI